MIKKYNCKKRKQHAGAARGGLQCRRAAAAVNL